MTWDFLSQGEFVIPSKAPYPHNLGLRLRLLLKLTDVIPMIVVKSNHKCPSGIFKSICSSPFLCFFLCIFEKPSIIYLI